MKNLGGPRRSNNDGKRKWAALLYGVTPVLAIPALLLALVLFPGLAAARDRAGSGAQPTTQPTTQAPAAPAWQVAYFSANAVASTPLTQAATCTFHTLLGAGGDQLRLEFADSVPSSATSNFHLTAAAVTVGSTQSPVTFDGDSGVTVAAHNTVKSDPIGIPVQAGETVAVEVTVDHGDMPHALVADASNVCNPAMVGPTGTPTSWLQAVQVDGTAARTVVTLGDSITEGLGVPVDSDARWTDVLDTAGNDVVNGGVTGGQLTGAGPCGSLDGLTRLPAELAEPGVTDLVIALGTNDIATGSQADEVLAALSQATQEAEQAHVSVSIATILPRGGVSTWTAEMEQARDQVNATLRGWAAEGRITLVDFDAAMRDPGHPDELRPADRQSDLTHPNASGQRVLATTAATALDLNRPR
jgi:lysophospholipase L1-like esterase